jgi:hypothetical protein
LNDNTHNVQQRNNTKKEANSIPISNTQLWQRKAIMLVPKTRSVIPLSTATTSTRIVQEYKKLIYSSLKTINAKINHHGQGQLYARTSKRCHASSSSSPPSSSKKETPMVTKPALKAFAVGTVAGLLGSLAGMGGGFGTFFSSILGRSVAYLGPDESRRFGDAPRHTNCLHFALQVSEL